MLEEITILLGDYEQINRKVQKLKRDLENPVKTPKRKKYLVKQLNRVLSNRKQIASKLASKLAETGGILNHQGKYDEALEYYHRSLEIGEEIFGKRSDQVACSLNNIGTVLNHQGKHEEALEYHHRSLEIHEEIFGKKSHQVATSLNNIGSVLGKQGKYDEALKHIKKSLAIYLECFGPKHYRTCLIIFSLARCYILFATTLPIEEAKECYQEAVLLCESLLETNREIIHSSAEELSSFDLIDHNKLLHRLGGLYRQQGMVSKAAELYQQEAENCQDMFPELGLRYIDCAIKDYAYLSDLPDSQQKVAGLYYCKATIYHKQQQLGLAIRSLKKSLTIQEDENRRRTLREWQAERAEILTEIDEDLYVQLEYCIDTYYALQRGYIEDLAKEEEKPTLSERTKNQTTELIIRIRNLLDQAYGRLVKAVIYGPNNREGGYCYYPIFGSKIALESELIKRRIINLKRKITTKDVEIKSLSKIIPLIIKTLKKYGYLDEKNCLTQQFFEDPSLGQLPIEFDPYRVELAQKLQSRQSHLEINCAFLGKQKISIKKPPSGERIFRALAEKEFIEEIIPDTGRAFWQLTIKFKPDEPGFSLKLRENEHDDEEFRLFECQIIARLKECLVRQERTQSLLEDYPEVYQNLIFQQSFTFYNSEYNKDKSYWREAWLEKVSAINIDSKHIRLTPQAVADNLKERTGFLHKKKVEALIHYLEPRFYIWSFVDVLAPFTASSLTDEEKIILSRKTLSALHQKGYIDKQVLVHPLALAIVEAEKNKDETSEAKIQELKTAFRGQVKKDLPEEAKRYSDIISYFLIRRALQRGHVRLEPDILVNAPKLIERALTNTRMLLQTFGRVYSHSDSLAVLQEVDVVQASATVISPQRFLTLAPKQIDELKISLEKEWNDLIVILKTETSRITIEKLQKSHHLLKQLSQLHRLAKQPGLLGDHYREIAEAIEEKEPWLALQYYRKSSLAYMRDQSKTASLAETLFQQGKLFLKLSLLEKAIKCFGKAKDAISVSERLKLTTVLTEETVEKFLKETKLFDEKQLEEVDDDIKSQLEHAKESYQQLLYLCFKLTLNLKDSYLVQVIQNRVIDLIIKIRHLLDQSYGRFVKVKIYRPNNNEKTDIKYPCVGSRRRLEDELRDARIINNPPDKTLSSYSQVYLALQESQPFYYRDEQNNRSQPGLWQRSWLEKIVEISNQAKHVKLTLPTYDQLKARHQPTGSIEEFFPINYIEKSIYDWTFVEIFKGNLKQSTELVGELKRLQYVKENGSVKSSELKDIARKLKLGQNAQAEILKERLAEKMQQQSPMLKECSAETQAAVLDKLIQHAQKALGQAQITSTMWLPATKLIEQALSESGKIIRALYKEMNEPKTAAEICAKYSRASLL